MKYGIGIDISKRKSTIAILSVAGEVIEEPFEMSDNMEWIKFIRGKNKRYS